MRDAPRGPVKGPAEASVVGQTLMRNGAEGAMLLTLGPDKSLAVARLTLMGEEIAAAGAPCQVDLIAGAPVAATTAARRDGLLRYAVAIDACPLAVDILEGAVLSSGAACVVKACRVQPTGLWGPPPSALGPARAKDIERSRARAEVAMRTAFKALIGSTKDKNEIIAIARDQASFSSQREEQCRDYAQEATHGFCAARMTEARGLALRARLAAAPPRPGKPRRRSLGDHSLRGSIRAG